MISAESADTTCRAKRQCPATGWPQDSGGRDRSGPSARKALGQGGQQSGVQGNEPRGRHEGVRGVQGREEEVRARPWHQMTQGPPTPSYQPPVLSKEGGSHTNINPEQPPEDAVGRAVPTAVSPLRGPQSRRQMRGTVPGPTGTMAGGGALGSRWPGCFCSQENAATDGLRAQEPCQGHKGQRAVTWEGAAPHGPKDRCSPGGGLGKAPSIPISRGKRQWASPSPA